jgi:ferritin
MGSNRNHDSQVLGFGDGGTVFGANCFRISRTMEQALNKQVNRELYSAYLCLAMSSYFETVTMKGFAHWMRAQAKEEHSHAMKIDDYIIARGGKASLLCTNSGSNMVFCR